LHVRVANAGYRQAQVTDVWFCVDHAALPATGRLTIPQLEPAVTLPRLLGENESVLFEYGLENFDPSRGLSAVEVVDGVGNIHRADVPTYQRDQRGGADDAGADEPS